MNDLRKTKAQLIEELAATRHRVTKLETQTTKYAQITETNKRASREHEQRLLAEKLYEIGTILSSSLNYETVLDNILEQMANLIPYDAACILLIRGETVRIARWRGYAYSEMEHTFLLQIFPIAKFSALQTICETRQPLLVSVADTHDPWIHGHGKQWIKSHMGVPISIQDQIIGFLNLDSAIPGYFSQPQVDLIQRFTKQAATALKHAQIYDEARREIAQRVRIVKQERNFVSTILNTTSALVMVLSPQGRILRLNRAFEQTSGYSLEEVQGKFFWELFLPSEALSRLRTIFKDLQFDQLPDEFESYWLTKAKKRKLVTWSNSVLLDNQGQVEYIISTGIDITDRRQLEERLVALHQLGRELNLLRDETAIYNIALETASFLLQIRSSGHGVLDQTTNELNYTYYPQRGIPQMINLTLPLHTQKRIDQLEMQRQAGQKNEDNKALEEITSRHAWLTAPMQVKNRLIGVLDVESQELNQFTANDQQLLQTLADQTAVAIENARLHRETQKRIDELTTLSMISQAITSTLDLEETLTIITNHTIRLIDAMAASVVLCDEAKGDLWFHSASGGVSDVMRGMRLPAGHGIVGWVIQQSEPVLVSDVAQDPRFFDKFDQMSGFKTDSVICVPLKAGQKTIGAIEVINKTNGSFTKEDLRLLTWLATPAAIAIENARLFEAEHTARERAERLQEATATLTSTLDLDKVLNGILVQLEQVVPYDNAYIFLQREDWLYVVARRGESLTREEVVGHRYATDNDIYQEIKRTGHPVILADARADVRFERWEGTETVHGWMGIPLTAQSRVIGCLTLDSQQAGIYGQTKATFAQAFANQAAVAIQNAQLFRQVRIGHKQLRSLSRRLVEVQESERRLIARELHDEAGQALTSLMVGLRLLEDEAEQPETIISRVADLKRLTNDISENLHRLARDLRPASLDYLGLIAALRQYATDFGQQHSLAMHFEAVGFDDQRLPATVEINLYRIAQEALTNVARHAQATRVDIFLEQRSDRAVILVEDNGIGFDSESVKQQGRLGLLGMSERTEMLNGELVVESTEGTGTTIYVEVPYEHSNSNS